MPERVQLRRTKGWKMPPNTVIVDRRTVFGNPSACRKHGCKRNPCACCDMSGEDYCCLDVFREYVMSGLEGRPSRTATFNVACDAVAGYPHRTELIRRLPELRGKNLACWCALNRPCHADVLLELANEAHCPGDENG